ncbi:ATP-dependent DNA helicase, partial [Micromonospora sp. DH15]|nr:ATP-dependent DNA helicase [Micromonospora sp. DH15]
MTPPRTAPGSALPRTSRRRGKRADAGELLAAAVGAVPGGAARPGQQQMAAAIAECVASGEHLLVQAGTGTGKSLGYLAPALT